MAKSKDRRADLQGKVFEVRDRLQDERIALAEAQASLELVDLESATDDLIAKRLETTEAIKIRQQVVQALEGRKKALLREIRQLEAAETKEARIKLEEAQDKVLAEFWDFIVKARDKMDRHDEIGHDQSALPGGKAHKEEIPPYLRSIFPRLEENGHIPRTERGPDLMARAGTGGGVDTLRVAEQALAKASELYQIAVEKGDQDAAKRQQDQIELCKKRIEAIKNPPKRQARRRGRILPREIAEHPRVPPMSDAELERMSLG